MSDTLGEYITKKRKSIGLTQEALSEALQKQGISRASTTISNWEADRGKPPIEVLIALAEILNEPSPTRLFDLAGYLDKIPGRDIVRMLDGRSTRDIERARRVIHALLQGD
jgi:transcriptional regulator with XRE-family HTH domain